MTTVPVRPSRRITWPEAIRAIAPGAPITAGMPRECARIAACEVRVPSSLMTPSTWSRSNCTVIPGESSRATMITFSWVWVTQASSASLPERWRSTRIWIAERSESRSRRRWFPAPDQATRSSRALNSKAVSALSRFWRMRCSTAARKSGSWTIRIWASKIRDSSSPARVRTRSRRAARLSTTASMAKCSRRISDSTSLAGIDRSGTSGNRLSITRAGATASPGETPIPRSVRAGIRTPRTRRPRAGPGHPRRLRRPVPRPGSGGWRPARPPASSRP